MFRGKTTFFVQFAYCRIRSKEDLWIKSFTIVTSLLRSRLKKKKVLSMLWPNIPSNLTAHLIYESSDWIMRREPSVFLQWAAVYRLNRLVSSQPAAFLVFRGFMRCINCVRFRFHYKLLPVYPCVNRDMILRWICDIFWATDSKEHEV